MYTDFVFDLRYWLKPHKFACCDGPSAVTGNSKHESYYRTKGGSPHITMQYDGWSIV
jgi:hypothetical protein